MSGRLNWSKPRRVFPRWYEAELLPWDERLENPGRIARSLVRQKTSDQKLAAPAVVKPVTQSTVAAGAFLGKVTLRTRDLAQARRALAMATDARVWCDGGCSPNPGQMGYGALIVAGAIRVELFGGGEIGTCNIAELKAALMGLAVLPARCSVTMHADSKYTVDGITSWIKGWKKNGFKTKTGGPVKNRALWMALDGLSTSRVIRWVWTRGHVGDVGNETAHLLATLGRGAVARRRSA
jgi:ribonuclease HI